MISKDITNYKVIEKLLNDRLHQKFKYDYSDGRLSFKFDKGSTAHKSLAVYIDEEKDVDITNTFTHLYFDMLKQENYEEIDWDRWDDCGWGLCDINNEHIITTIKVRETKTSFNVVINFDCNKWNDWLTNHS